MSGSEILTQEEIDVLLDNAEAVASGSSKQSSSGLRGQVEPYDIFQPESASRMGMPDLKSLPEDLAREISRKLDPPWCETVALRLSCEPSLQPLGDYIKSISSPCAIGIGALPDLADPLLLILDANAVRSLVDVLFGGDGASPSRPGGELTGTELRVATRILKRAGQLLADVVEPKARFVWQRLETSPAAALAAPPRSQFACLNYALGVGSGSLHINFPRDGLEQLCGSEDFAAGAPRDEASFSAWLLSNATQAPVQVHAQVAEIQLSVRDLLRLGAGDFIPADISRNVILQVDSRPVLQGILGVSASMNAVHVVGPACDPEAAYRSGSFNESTRSERP